MPPKKPTSKKAATPKKQGKITGFFATPTSSSKPAATKRGKESNEDVPPAKRVPNVPDVTPEQQKQIDQNKSEAEVKLLKKKLGVDDLDASWVEALYSEFKKPYFTEVIILFVLFLMYNRLVI